MTDRGLTQPTTASWRDYFAIARADHWFKNFFVLPGAALAVFFGVSFGGAEFANLVLALVSVCAIASANYTINEWLDAEFDRFHPTKSARPAAAGRIRSEFVYLQWVMLAALGLGLGYFVSLGFFACAVALLVMGAAYNINPVRTKDRAYLDVLSESVNNPIRLLMGWFAIAPDAVPPASILVAYWMGGAFLMAIKRYAEYRQIDNPSRAALYRKSFGAYTANSLMLSAFFYAMTSAFFLGAFMLKYRIELLISFPLFALLFAWYLRIGMRDDSVTQTPERLYKEKAFVGYVVALCAIVCALMLIDLPFLQFLVERHALG
jgi:4-hydroxybenzoate polyprenyltransferase